MVDITIREMLDAGVHYGHKTRYWNPKMGTYIYGSRNNIHIIDLEQTKVLFKNALSVIEKASTRKSKILFVGTKRAASDIIRESAQQCNMPYVDYRWLGGMLTNYKTIRGLTKHLNELEVMSSDGTFDKLTKKEVLTLRREMTKLERSIGGIKNMVGLPDLIFIIDTGHERIAVNEANRLSIPVIGIVDTNNTPEGIDHVVPGNDDGMRAIRLYTEKVVQTILAAQASHAKEEVKAPAPEQEAMASIPAVQAQPAVPPASAAE